MTRKEEMALRELAAGRCTPEDLMGFVGPTLLFTRDGFEREIKKAVRAEREKCLKLFNAAAQQVESQVRERIAKK